MRFRNSAASGPTTSILPSVERVENAGVACAPPGIRARPRRAWSRRPGGNTARASIAPTSSKTAPMRLGPGVRSACGGRDRTVRRANGPAKVPKVTGVIGRAESGQARLRAIDSAERSRRDRERVHVRGLALIGRHAGRRVALDMLDRAQALAHGELDVLGGDVVLEIDEGLAPSGGPAHAARRRGSRRGARWRRETENERSLGAPAAAAPARGPRRGRRQRSKVPLQAPTDACVLRRDGLGQRFRVAASKSSLPRGLREEMHRRRPAARHQDDVACRTRRPDVTEPSEPRTPNCAEQTRVRPDTPVMTVADWIGRPAANARA